MRFFILLLLPLALSAEFYYSGGKKHTLHAIKKTKALSQQRLFSFQSEQGKKLSYYDKIIVAYDDMSIKEEIEKRYQLTHCKTLTKEMFLYQVQTPTKTLDIANSIYEENGVKLSHPDFQRTKSIRALTTDPHSSHAWHLKDEVAYNHADINIEQAWQYTKGAGVKVAVYDEGIDITHEDLKKNILKYANFNDTTTNNPYLPDDTAHGTACVGLIAAAENYHGSVGVAPESSVYAVRYSDSNVSMDIIAYQWMMDEGVSVISNSWGTYNMVDAFEEVLRELATQGRNGKGIVIIFASGNDSYDLDNDTLYNQILRTSSTIADESESPYVTSISASTINNRVAAYSNHGNSVDFAAPGGSSEIGLYTTDTTGATGYTTTNYNNNFTGTSAAAPLVAGTVTLMLSVNPDLTRTEVLQILKVTAQKIGDYNYDEEGHNNYLGYGKIDAGLAVEMAIMLKKSKLKNFARRIYNTIN